MKPALGSNGLNIQLGEPTVNAPSQNQHISWFFMILTCLQKAPETS